MFGGVGLRLGTGFLLSNVIFYTTIFNSFPDILRVNFLTGQLEDERASERDGRELAGEFDFIIVGGGSAGCLLANRLSRDRNLRVLVLERGGNPDSLVDVPMYFPLLLTAETTYGYTSVPQNNAFISTGNVVPEVRGRGLGGTGNINFMMNHRGDGRCYDVWANLTDDPSWSWRNVLPYFKKFEDYHGHFRPVDTRVHGVGGELTIEEVTFRPSAQYFYAAAAEKGFRFGDVNTGDQNPPVVSIGEMTRRRGRRWSGYKAFLQPVLHRKNLVVIRFAQVVKVNVDENLRATGVTYIRHGVTKSINARQEVILSAGTFDTPKILMLSGIGPAKHLRSLNIKVIKDLPVGENLQDHTAAVVDGFRFNASVAFVPPRDLTPSTFFQWAAHGTGPLSIPAVGYGVGFLSTKQNPNPEIPDIQFYISGTNRLTNPTVDESTLGKDSTRDPSQLTPENYPDANSISVTMVQPDETGTVRLKSANPEDDPLIDPRVFSKRSDLTRLIEGVKTVVDIFLNSSAFRKIDAKLVVTNMPPSCQGLVFQSDAYWECHIRYFTATDCHPVGTCRMGRPNDPRSVVDSRLRVLGIKGLRVVDGSIIPRIINANTNTPIYMIAERAASFILNENAGNLRYT